VGEQDSVMSGEISGYLAQDRTARTTAFGMAVTYLNGEDVHSGLLPSSIMMAIDR
jgi:hypothetical protein